jgi:cobalt/nickel transport system permease protein
VIDVARIDYWAASGAGPFHRASVLSKGVFLMLAVLAAISAKSPCPLAVGYGVMLLAAVAAGLPWLRMLALSLYAAVFPLIYGLSLEGGTAVFAVLLLKALTAALAMLTLIVSTPYPRVFALLGSVLPEVLAAGLFMTYRTFFILLDMMHNFGAAIRLRGGFSPGSLYKNGSNISKGIGMLLVRAVERSSRLYAVMTVRGYNGSMAEPGADRPRKEDWLPLALGAAVFALALVWKP